MVESWRCLESIINGPWLPHGFQDLKKHIYTFLHYESSTLYIPEFHSEFNGHFPMVSQKFHSHGCLPCGRGQLVDDVLGHHWGDSVCGTELLVEGHNPWGSNGFGLAIPIGSMYAIYGNMDPINIPQMLAYIPYMDPMGYGKNPVKSHDFQSFYFSRCFGVAQKGGTWHRSSCFVW